MMAKARTAPVYLQLRFYHILIWLLFFLLSLRYFTIAAPGLAAWLIALVTTVFGIVTFYISAFYLIPLITGEHKRIIFFTSVTLFLTGISFFRTILELSIYRLFFKDAKYIYFMGLFWSSVFLTGFILLLAIAIRLSENSYREKEKMNAIVSEKLLTELTYLKNQVHPHFLFNIHNTIFFLINENPGLASEMLLKLSDLMRYQLYECEAKTVPLEKELLNISNYIDLEKVRLGSKVNVDINFVTNLANIQIAPFMLMPLVENAVKHISRFSDRPNYIRITAGFENKELNFTVVNSYETEDKELNKAWFSKGIGLQNLQRRLNLIYGDKSDMNFTSLNNLFTVNLKLQLL
jgi:two-component system LytT family sensor kinase